MFRRLFLVVPWFLLVVLTGVLLLTSAGNGKALAAGVRGALPLVDGRDAISPLSAQDWIDEGLNPGVRAALQVQHAVADKQWLPLAEGLGQHPFAIATEGSGDVYAGGGFRDALGTSPCGGCNYIARWDGSSWRPLGQGLNGNAVSLVIGGDGNLYAGGSFDNTFDATCDTCNGVAMWDGTNWSALGQGLTTGGPGGGQVQSLAVDGNGNLYAGGAFGFSAPPCTGCKNIAMWDGSSWSGLDEGLDGNVEALAVDSERNRVYAGGPHVSNTGGSPGSCDDCNRVAMWDGSSWQPLGQGLGSDDPGTYSAVDALAVDSNGKLYAGGWFTDTYAANCTDCNHIAVWDGSSWGGLGQGLNDWVYVLAIDSSDNLYVGGLFSDTVSSTCDNCNYIGMWDGSGWSAFNQGLDWSVRALALDDGDVLYAGGGFLNTYDGTCDKCNRIAKWALAEEPELPWRAYLPLVVK